jgi:hypothetical protein
VEGNGLISRGYVGLNNSTNVPAGTSNLLFAVPKATALFYGTVLDNLGNPLPGIDVSDYDNNNLYQSDGYTDAGGNYAVAALGGVNNEAWQVSVSSDSSSSYIFSQSSSQTNGDVVLGADTATLANFTAILAPYTISGHLTNGTSGTPFASIGIYAYASISGVSFYVGSVDTDANGFYSLNVANGTWNLGVNNYCQNCGNSDGLPSGYFAPSTSVLVSNGNVTVNITAIQGTNTISGYLTDDNSNPIPNVGVYANMNGQNNLNVSADTDSSGHYSLLVFNGSWNVGINTCRNCGNSDNLPTNYLAPQGITVLITNDNVITNFVAILAPYSISGYLKDNNGVSIAGVGVYGYMNNGQNNNPYADTDASGHYSLNVDNGTWNVGIQSCQNCGNNDNLPTNYLAPQQQTVVIANGNGTANFIAYLATNIISGYVRDNNGPIANVGVYAYINGQNGSQNTDTDATGHYSINVDNGAWNVSLNCNNGGNDSLDNILGGGNYACPPTQFATISGNNNATNNFTVQLCGGVSISASLPAGEVGVYYDQFLQASSCFPTFTWLSLTGHLPPGVNWNPSAGEISGLPTNAGTTNFTVRVQDGDGRTANQTLSLTINQPVQITTSSLPNGANGVSFSQQLQATNGVPPYDWSVAPGSADLPLNMSLSSNGLFSGTPTNSEGYGFTVLVTDSLGGTNEQSLSFTVIAVTNLQITTTSLTAATQNVPYTNTLTAAGGQPPYSWSLATGSSLPSGLTLATNGLLEGTTTNSGSNSFTVKVTDALGAKTNQLLTLTVNPQFGSLQVTISPPDVLTNGALWQVDSNSFQISGAVVNNLSVGNHRVSFKTISGWTTPPNQSVTITANQTANVTGTYVPIPTALTGALQVTITPSQAVSAGAEWRIGSGAFHTNGAIVTNLSPTNVIISFKPIPGFFTPANQTNLIIGGQTNPLTGLYLSTNKPTLAITQPRPGQNVSSADFTVIGWAYDKVAVDSVYYQLNVGEWSNAHFTSLSTNWSAPVTLTPGTNTFRAYAVNTSSNASHTNSVSFFYVVTNQLDLSTVGLGTLSPNYSNVWLDIGRNYRITAAPKTGFRFTNWTGSFPTNSSNVTFRMASNLTLIANFVDIAPPSDSITFPTNTQRWSNSTITVKGTSRDNVQVANVFYQINGGAWTPATPTNNSWSNWTARLTLTQSGNTLRTYAQDTAGNNSTTNKVSFVFVPSAMLTVQTNGDGTFTPKDNEKLLAIGTNYTLTATPGHDFIFSNWVASGGTNFVSTNHVLTFAMTSNLTLTANFVTNLFLAAQGAYHGLFAPETPPRQQTNSGAFVLNITTNGAFSGKLYLGLETNSLTGQFDLSGHAQAVSTPPGPNALTASLQLDLTDQSVAGTVSNNSFAAALHGDQAFFNAARPATNYKGRYTLVIPGTNDPTIGPLGASYGTVTVDAFGNITFAGSLADGTTSVSQSSVVSKDGYWWFYVPLYNGAGSLWGTNFFTNHTISSVPYISWINATNANRSAFYRSGFTNDQASLLGSIYNPAIRPFLNVTGEFVTLGATNPAFPLTDLVTLTSSNTFISMQSIPDPIRLTLTISTNTGVVTGTFRNPTNSHLTNTIHGILLQDQLKAQGYFLGTNQIGSFLLTPF